MDKSRPYGEDKHPNTVAPSVQRQREYNQCTFGIVGGSHDTGYVGGSLNPTPAYVGKSCEGEAVITLLADLNEVVAGHVESIARNRAAIELLDLLDIPAVQRAFVLYTELS